MVASGNRGQKRGVSACQGEMAGCQDLAWPLSEAPERESLGTTNKCGVSLSMGIPEVRPGEAWLVQDDSTFKLLEKVTQIIISDH